MNLNMRKFLLICVVAIVIIWFVYPQMTSSEGFAPKNDNMNYSQPNTIIKPMLYEPDLALVTSASEFVGMPDVVVPAWGVTSHNDKYGQSNILDDGDMGNAGLNYNMCSKSCCSPQYPPPFPLGKDDLVEKNKGKFVGSGYACNNAWQDSGCMCMTKKQSDFLASRGNNGWNNSDIRNLSS